MYKLGEPAPGWTGDPTYFATMVVEKNYLTLATIECGSCGASYNGVVNAKGIGPKEIYYGAPELISWSTKCVLCKTPIEYLA